MNIEIEKYFDGLAHAHKAIILEVFAQISASNPPLEQNVKWNAPNFTKNGVDCVTFRLCPKDIFQVIIHRGAKVKNTDDFVFPDPHGLAKWAARDRGIFDFLKNPEENPQKLLLINQWIAVI